MSIGISKIITGSIRWRSTSINMHLEIWRLKFGHFEYFLHSKIGTICIVCHQYTSIIRTLILLILFDGHLMNSNQVLSNCVIQIIVRSVLFQLTMLFVFMCVLQLLLLCPLCCGREETSDGFDTFSLQPKRSSSFNCCLLQDWIMSIGRFWVIMLVGERLCFMITYFSIVPFWWFRKWAYNALLDSVRCWQIVPILPYLYYDPKFYHKKTVDCS